MTRAANILKRLKGYRQTSLARSHDEDVIEEVLRIAAGPTFFEHDEALLEQLCQDLQDRTSPDRDQMWDGLKMDDVKDIMKTYALQMLRKHAK